MFSQKLSYVLLGCYVAFSILVSSTVQAENAQWWKGNLHTHSLWSDGDDYPEMIVNWYKENGYHFVALSDHNVLSQGERWINPENSSGGMKAFEKYIEKYGEEWVEIANADETHEGKIKRLVPFQSLFGESSRSMEEMRGKLLVRLKPLNEFRTLFEESQKFMLLQAEEITDYFHLKELDRNLPVHLNATNLIEHIDPQGGDSVHDTLQNNINAVLEQREKTGQPMFPHINHPNFGWAITAEDIMGLEGEKFFEVYNGHPYVNNEGNEVHASTERMWDIILTKRLAELDLPVMYGIATDDSHNYHDFKQTNSNPGRGWIQVKSQYLTPESIIHAMERGDFYGSSGVDLLNINSDQESISIEIKSEPGVTYTTQFIGTRKGYNPESHSMQNSDSPYQPLTRSYSNDIGEILAVEEGNTPSYHFDGDEIYVRAKIISSKKKENPYSEGEVEQAWVQPVVLNSEQN